MKNIILVLVLFIPSLSFGQYEYGFLQESFFVRQPSARAESMGKGYSSIDGDLATVFYNPAGTATLQGLEVNASYASPLYLLENAKYSFISVGYNINKYLTTAISINHFNSEDSERKTDSAGNITYSDTPTNTIYSLNISTQPIKDLFVGLNSNYLVWKTAFNPTSSTIYFDFGIIKKFQFGQKEMINHSVNLGASITNLNFSKIDSDFDGNEPESSLPVITRYSANYQFFFNKKLLIDSLNFLRFLIQGEYQLLLNSEYNSGIHTGMEITFLEILSLRAGYYREEVKSNHLPAVLKSEIHSFTYGFGLQIPLFKLTNIPLNINFDFTTLPQVNYLKTQSTWDNFSSFTLRINWII